LSLGIAGEIGELYGTFSIHGGIGAGIAEISAGVVFPQTKVQKIENLEQMIIDYLQYNVINNE